MRCRTDRALREADAAACALAGLPDASERQKVVIRIADLVRGELPVPAADDVVFAIVNQ